MGQKKKLKKIIKNVRKDCEDVIKSVDKGQFSAVQWTYEDGLRVQADVTIGIIKGFL